MCHRYVVIRTLASKVCTQVGKVRFACMIKRTLKDQGPVGPFMAPFKQIETYDMITSKLGRERPLTCFNHFRAQNRL